jgi:hypothetical protein
MAPDPANGALATVFRSPARLVLLDTKTGAVAANVPASVDADDVFFDARRGRTRLFVPEPVRPFLAIRAVWAGRSRCLEANLSSNAVKPW